MILIAIRNSRLAALACLSVVFSASSPTQNNPAQPLVSAHEAVGRIMANDPESKIELAEQAHAEHLKKFATQLGTEKPAVLATQWIALVDAAIALPHRSFSGMMGGSPAQPVGTLFNVLIAMPGPEAWPFIKTQVLKRPPSVDRTALLLLVARLAGDDAGVIRLCDEYDRQMDAIHPRDTRFARDPERDTQPTKLDAYWRLDRMKEPDAVRLAQQVSGEIDLYGVPSKVAQTLLLDYLKKPGNQLYTRNVELRRLAKDIALSHLREIPYPHWELADDSIDLPYVFKLVDRYGYKSLIGSNGQGNYKQIYFYGLIVHKDLNKAIQLLSDVDDVLRLDESEWPQDNGIIPFIEGLQDRFPRKDFSFLLARAVLGIHKPADAANRIRKLASDSRFTHDQKLLLLSKLLEADAMAGNLTALSSDVDAIDKQRTRPGEYDPAYKLIETAMASGNRALIDKLVNRSLKEAPSYPNDGLLQALMAGHRYGELEQLAISNCREVNPGTGPSEIGARMLCDAYYRAGRPHDVLTVLEKFPNWDQSTIALEDSRDRYSGYSSLEESRQPLGFYAAWAHLKTGRADLAIQGLRSLLLEKGDNVSCYRLLNEIGSRRCLDIYSELRAAFPYSNAAVLWESDLLFRLGKVKQAWAGIQKAIAIDPIGDYPYREKLANLTRQILAKHGDAAGAARAGIQLNAIRMGHRGEQLAKVSLLPQAEEAFSRALSLCPTDSALLAGLGNCLELENQKPDAQRLYLRALESITSAMGEATSESSQIGQLLTLDDLGAPGREVLGRVIAKYPKSSAAYQARGMLNRACSRYSDAAADFRKALALDPNRIDAIDSLIAITREAHLNSKDAETLALKKIHLTLQMDVDFWTDNIGMANIGDLSTIYRAIHTRLKGFPLSIGGPMFPLHANIRNERLSIYPEFDPFTLEGRLPGRFFQIAKDVGNIARLYHPTRYPFE